VEGLKREVEGGGRQWRKATMGWKGSKEGNQSIKVN